MKNNRKNRKLKFIQQKNLLRKGIAKVHYQEVFGNCKEHLNRGDEIIKAFDWDGFQRRAIIYFKKIWKIEPKIFQIQPFVIIEDDFATDKYIHVMMMKVK